MYRLGEKLRDKITGFTGTAVARIEYINGCIQYQLRPGELKNGKMLKAEWIDKQQLELETETEIITRRRGGGGPGDTPPEFVKP